MPERHVQLSFDGTDYVLPVAEPTIGNPGLGIGQLRNDTGAVTFDPGFANTAGARSSITYIDGGAGVLQHRGYAIEDLAANASFLEVAYLLLFKKLPTRAELDVWEDSVRHHTLLNEEMKRFFDAFPKSAHPMAILSSATNAISTFYEEFHDPTDELSFNESALRLIAKMPTIAAWAYKKSTGMPYCYPRNDLGYVENFIHMMFHLPVQQEEVDPVLVKALNVLLILHADHEMNCSTSTVRGVGSSRANMFTSVAAGMGALWGPLHGGANVAVIEQLERIHSSGISVKELIERVKRKEERLFGFGHGVYKSYDPRANILRDHAPKVLANLGRQDPLLDIARRMEEVALSDDYFVSRNLYPNVDFYSGVLLRAMGIPVNMYTVMFAIGRMPGWIAQWKEVHDNQSRIYRPRQVYMGSEERDYVPLRER